MKWRTQNSARYGWSWPRTTTPAMDVSCMFDALRGSSDHITSSSSLCWLGRAVFNYSYKGSDFQHWRAKSAPALLYCRTHRTVFKGLRTIESSQLECFDGKMQSLLKPAISTSTSERKVKPNQNLRLLFQLKIEACYNGIGHPHS